MNKRTKAHCNKCNGIRNHEVLFAEQSEWYEEDTRLSGSDEYNMLKCCGCDNIILRHTSCFSGQEDPTVTYYPPAMSRREPPWLWDMSVGENTIYVIGLMKEIYIGIQNRMPILATMGVRALLEFVMVDSVGDHGSFANNLTEFEKKGYISDRQRIILDAVLETGHATTHRAYKPSDADLSTCMDIAETVLQNIYIHPQKAAELKSRIPKRK